MKSSFPKLQTAVDDVLARSSAGQLNEQEHQKVIASAKSFVAGISVSSEATIVARKDEAVKKLIAGANAFALSATSIRTELGQLGVTPLAVLPVAMWEDIVKKSGLYMFAGAHGNTFQVSDAIEEVPRRVEKAVGDFQKIFSGASAIVTLGATLYLLFGSYQLRIEIFFYLAGFLILFLLSKSLTKKVLSPAIVQWKVKQSVKKSGGANQFLWPNKKTPDASLAPAWPSCSIDFGRTHRSSWRS